MRTAKPSRGACCAALLVSACSSANDLPEAAQPVESPTAANIGTPPFEGPPSSAPPPLLNTGEPNADGAFSTFVQLNEQPRDISFRGDEGFNRENRWRSLVAGDAFTTPPNLAVQLGEGLAAARQHSETTNITYDILHGLSSVFPNLGASVKPTVRTIAYRPERARWISERWDGAEGSQRPPPPALSELRGRGERLYCAVMNAARKQTDTHSSPFLGKVDLIEIPLPGGAFPILRVEPTLTIEPPQRFDTRTNDGAQAFVLPFQAGVRASIFPSIKGGIKMPEMVMPVAAVTADSEISTPVDFGSSSGTPSRGKFQTATHAMAFSGSTFDAQAESTRITFGKIGPIDLFATVGLQAGMTTCSEHGSYADCQNEVARDVGRLIADVQQGPNAAAAPFGTPARWAGSRSFTSGSTNAGSGEYSERPWTVDTQLWQGTTRGFDQWFPTRLPDPLAARMVQNNDKSFVVESNFGLTITVGAAAGLRYPENAKDEENHVDFSADVRAQFGLSSTVLHRFREQEELMVRMTRVSTPEGDNDYRQGVPLTALTVTPGVQFEPLRLDLSGNLNVVVKVPLLSLLKFNVELFRIGKNVGIEPRPSWWSEDHRLRLTTMQSYYGTVESNVMSHLPHGGVYPTFEDRRSCEVPQPNPPPPYKRCEPERATGGESGLNIPLCIVAPIREVAPDRDRDPELACFLKVQAWLRTGSSLEQDVRSERAIARVLSSPADWEASARAVADCAGEYTRLQSPVEGLTSYLRYAPCDATATVLEAPISPVFNAREPASGATSEPCHP